MFVVVRQPVVVLRALICVGSIFVQFAFERMEDKADEA